MNIQYKEYLEIQKRSEDLYKDEEKNFNKEGHRFDDSNVILVNLLKNLKVTGKVLDIGCNTGYHTEQIKEFGNEVVGVDVNERLLEIARKHGRDYCVYGDMHDLKLGSKEFDIVFMHEVLEHALNLKKVLGEIYRVLKTGGHFVFSLPLEDETKVYQDENLKDKDPHFVKITPYELRKTLEDAEFKACCGYVFPIGNYGHMELWRDNDTKYGFQPHLHAVVQKQ